MIATTDWAGLAAVIAALGAAVASVIAAFRATSAKGVAQAVHNEIQTGNGKNIGQSVAEIKKTVNGGGTT